MSVKVEQVCAPAVLGEGPHWDDGQQCLYYVDILEYTIHKYVPATEKHTKTILNDYVGFILPVDGTKDRFVIGLGRRFVILQWNGEDDAPADVIEELAQVDADVGITRINDGKCDPKGRIFAGTMAIDNPVGTIEPGKGSLFRVVGTRCTKLATNISISNGLAWHTNSFYYIDSMERAISRFDYDATTGEISNKKHIFDFAKHGIEGLPDGMTIDTDGNLYVAVFSGSCVIKIDPKTDRLLNKIPIPAEQVTSVTFGGANLDVLYVTTANLPISKHPLPMAGALFKVTGLNARGHPNLTVKL